MITNAQSGTNIAEIAPGIYRINTPVPEIPGGFSFNQYLVLDDEPLVFHTGLRRMFPLVREATERVIPIEKLRYVAFSHFESDECGALNDFLGAAPNAAIAGIRLPRRQRRQRRRSRRSCRPPLPTLRPNPVR